MQCSVKIQTSFASQGCCPSPLKDAADQSANRDRSIFVRPPRPALPYPPPHISRVKTALRSSLNLNTDESATAAPKRLFKLLLAGSRITLSNQTEHHQSVSIIFPQTAPPL
ncbi:hypothetical protein T4B_12607 [Trichinella pseudospiralis]|uniref:Uncharacterized protein n=1 Tax=Trichinella pseudospiralis TaxID=6337 RepID=A0A0V1JY21_TRIPS|nr:hypothetical protein T4B_12607 [Trichinella pseudospiralis]KRZ39870.1 hypothetical protein T4C_9560 [Trichinella pseudospiralis]